MLPWIYPPLLSVGWGARFYMYVGSRLIHVLKGVNERRLIKRLFQRTSVEPDYLRSRSDLW